MHQLRLVERRRFQEGAVEGRWRVDVRLDWKAELVYQNLLSPVVENARLAALEITDGLDTARMPQLLESVRASVARTAQVLEQLIWQTTRASRGEPSPAGEP